MKFSAVILAGGRSQRMGQDKAWLLLDGKPLIARQIELARELGAEEIFISGRAGTDYNPLKRRVVYDRVKDAGPLAGIESALAASSAPLLLVLAVDMPKMTASPLQRLLVCCSETRGAVPRFNHQLEPLAAIYPRSSLKIAQELLDSGRYAAWNFAERCVEHNLAAFIDLPDQHSACFENWNTPAETNGERL
jgi:molybdenum cofactor guanylyltransferase